MVYVLHNSTHLLQRKQGKRERKERKRHMIKCSQDHLDDRSRKHYCTLDPEKECRKKDNDAKELAKLFEIR